MAALPQIALFGDSLTQFAQGPSRTVAGSQVEAGFSSPGWGDRLVEYYSRRADVINRGCFGYNTRDALAVDLVPAQVVVPNNKKQKNKQPELLFATLWFGANDACDAEHELHRKHVPVAEYEANLHALLDRTLALTKRVIVLTPTCVNEQVYARYRSEVVKRPVDRSVNLLVPYVSACKRVCESRGVQCIDMFQPTQRQANELLRDTDGLHLTAQGDELVFRSIIDLVESIWPECRVTPDPASKSYSNSASASPIDPFLPFWDKLGVDVQSNNNSSSTILDLGQRARIVLLGDSITQQAQGSPAWCGGGSDPAVAGPGWGDMLQAVYARRADVINRGYSGYNSQWVVDHVDRVFGSFSSSSSKVQLCTLFLGANDAAACGPQHLPLAQYSGNMGMLIQRCQQASERVVLIGPPPICHTKYVQWRRNRKENADKRAEEVLDRTYVGALQYSNAAKALAAQHKVPFVDVFELFSGGDFSALLSDGLHLNALGNAKLGQALIQRIASEWPELACTREPEYGYYGSQCQALPPHQPWFQDLHEANFAKVTTAAVNKRMKL